MACASCGKNARTTATYPRTVVLADGSRTTVTSAAQERAERERVQAQMRRNADTKGWTATR